MAQVENDGSSNNTNDFLMISPSCERTSWRQSHCNKASKYIYIYTHGPTITPNIRKYSPGLVYLYLHLGRRSMSIHQPHSVWVGEYQRRMARWQVKLVVQWLTLKTSHAISTIRLVLVPNQVIQGAHDIRSPK